MGNQTWTYFLTILLLHLQLRISANRKLLRSCELSSWCFLPCRSVWTFTISVSWTWRISGSNGLIYLHVLWICLGTIGIYIQGQQRTSDYLSIHPSIHPSIFHCPMQGRRSPEPLPVVTGAEDRTQIIKNYKNDLKHKQYCKSVHITISKLSFTERATCTSVKLHVQV